MIGMFDPRLLYATRPAFLGDVSGVDPSSRADIHQDPVCLDPSHPLSNYCTGRQDGWVRTFTRAGFFLSNQDLTLAPELRPTGPVPTVQEWAAFDAEAVRRGVAGYVQMLKKNATPSTDFLSTFSRILSKLGHSIESFQLDKALFAAQDGLNAIAGQIDKVIPGAGGLVLNYLLGALLPIAPLMSGLSGVIADAASHAGANLVASAVRGAGAAGSTFFQPPTVSTIEIDAAAQGQIGDSIVQSLTSFARSGATDLAPLKGTLLRLSAAYRTTNGSLGIKLASVAAEALKEYIAAVTITSAIITGGAAIGATTAAEAAAVGAFSIVSGLALTGSGALLTLDTALLQGDAVKTKAKAAKQLAYQEASALDREAADLEKQIAALANANAQQVASDQSHIRVLAALAAAVLLGRALA